jgi:LysR family nitrogen assimilation transcriptional regulator
MDIKALRTFVTVVELGSFSAAARRLRVAQPALSRQVKELEAGLDARLLSRSPRGVVPTEAGQRLQRFALEMLQRFERVRAVVHAHDEPIAGAVSIGLPTSTGAVLSVPLLRRAKQRFPGIRLHLIESLTGYLEEWVMAGRLDFAVLYNAEPSSKLQLTPLLVEKLCLIVPPGGPLAARKTVPFKELSRYPLIVPALPHTLRRMIEAAACSNGVQLRIAYEVDSLPALKTLARSGEACAVLSAGAVAEDLAGGILRALPIVRPSLVRLVSLAAPSLLEMTPAHIELVRLVVELAQELRLSGVWPGQGEMRNVR